mmetsp:Transcript_24981/g.37280  ORF Transcript_24981/g.37280 Transcript_24981/m.37280 type:complete len:139 (+) Transcript_24981:1172-1588(+)
MKKKKKSDSAEDDKDTARLHGALSWVAKKIGDNKGLEILQFQLGTLGRDLTNLNSLWDGSCVVKTQITIAVLFLSLILHFFVHVRNCWLVGTAIWYFGQSPHLLLLARYFLGFWRGIVKIARRRQLHHMEIMKDYKCK